MSKQQGHHEVNEKDIDGVLKYLKYFHPEHATPEFAIEFLEYMQEQYHTLSHEDPERLQEMFDALMEQKKNRVN